jgi:hypothetical protein
MSVHYERHVESVLKAFLDMLEPEAKAVLSEEHIDELSMLVESAITAAVFQQLEAVADEVNDVAVMIRRRAENFESSRKTS